jgi:hypothetical protein
MSKKDHTNFPSVEIEMKVHNSSTESDISLHMKILRFASTMIHIREYFLLSTHFQDNIHILAYRYFPTYFLQNLSRLKVDISEDDKG